MGDTESGMAKEGLNESRLIAPSAALKYELDIKSSLDDEQNQMRSSSMVHAFEVGTLGIILPQNALSELVENLSICKIPNTNPILHGIGSLRGKVIPVYNLQKIFSIESTKNTYYLVIDSGEGSIAVLLDRIPQQVEIGHYNKLNSIPPLPEILRSFAMAAYRDDQIWVECRLFDFFKSLKKNIVH